MTSGRRQAKRDWGEIESIDQSQGLSSVGDSVAKPAQKEVKFDLQPTQPSAQVRPVKEKSKRSALLVPQRRRSRDSRSSRASK